MNLQHSSPWAAIIYCIVCLALFIVVCASFVNNGHWNPLSDAWEQAATVRELARDFQSPSHPYYSDPAIKTPRYTIYIFIIALASRIFSFDVISTLNIVFFLNYVVLVSGIYLFYSRYTGNPLASVFALVTLVFFWGSSWYFSNVYSCTNLVLILFFPSITAFAVGFWGWYFYIAWLREKSLAGLCLFVFAGVFVFHTHPVTGSFFYLFSLCLLAEKEHLLSRGAVALVVSACVLIPFVTFWPYGNFWKNTFAGFANQSWYHPIGRDVLFMDIPSSAGFAFIGIPCGIWLLWRKTCRAVPLALGSCLGLALFAKVTDFGLLARYVVFSIFFCHFSAALFFVRLWSAPGSNGRTRGLACARWLTLLIIAAAVLLQIRLVSRNITFDCVKQALAGPRCNEPARTYAVLVKNLHRGDVVLADPVTSWVIPAMSGAKVIMPLRNIPFNTNRAEHVRDYGLFFAQGTSAAARKTIIRRYALTHIAFNRNIPRYQIDVLDAYDIVLPRWSVSLNSAMRQLGRQVSDANSEIVLFALNRNVP